MLCHNCKTENPPGSVVCYNCGVRFVCDPISLKPPSTGAGSIDKSYARRNDERSDIEPEEYLGLGYIIRALWSYISVFFLGLLSYIPPLGFLIRGEIKAGLIALGASTMLLLAIYNSVKSTAEVLLIYMLGMLCVTTCYLNITGYLIEDKKIKLDRVGRIALVVIASAVLTLIITIPLFAFYQIVRIPNDYFEPIFIRGDRVLFSYSIEDIRRNDVILTGTVRGYTIGYALALPGDTVVITKSKLYVNGEYAELSKNMRIDMWVDPAKESTGYLMEKNEFLVAVIMVRFGWVIHPEDVGLIQGRAVAIINPPDRRRWL
jgi:signal peptidase I